MRAPVGGRRSGFEAWPGGLRFVPYSCKTTHQIARFLCPVMWYIAAEIREKWEDHQQYPHHETFLSFYHLEHPLKRSIFCLKLRSYSWTSDNLPSENRNCSKNPPRFPILVNGQWRITASLLWLRLHVHKGGWMQCERRPHLTLIMQLDQNWRVFYTIKLLLLAICLKNPGTG